MKFLKKKPWGNLIENLTSTMSKPLYFYLLFYSLLLPILVIVTHLHSEINSDIVQIIINILAFGLFFFIPKYLRSGNNLLALGRSKKKGIFFYFYHLVMKGSGIFAVLFFSYTAIATTMLLLEKTTGIAQSQELPDMSGYSFLTIVYQSLTAGLTEEVWRVSAIIVTLLLLKKALKTQWEKRWIQGVSLFFSIFITSMVFGWLHSFGYSDSYFSVSITVQLGIVGVILAFISIISRRLWLAVLFHSFFDFVSISLNAKASEILISEKAYEQFMHDNISWVLGITGVFLLLFLCFLLSLFLIRFSKGGKK